MPIFTVKKILEDPDLGEEEKQVVVEMNVPNEIFSKILLMLDGRSLHSARQVCQEWNSAIKGEVLGTVEGRREMERTLQHQWRLGAPGKMEVTISGRPGRSRGSVPQ